MRHRERVKAALESLEVDRTPVSMWRHFFKEETSAEGLSEAMLAFQREYDWDFMKVNPRASYHCEDWGLKVQYDGDTPPAVIERPVRHPRDWLKLDVLDVQHGVLGEHLRALELIGKGLEDEVPFIMTVFTPLSIASRMAPSEDEFLAHLREHTDSVRQALEVITETFTSFSLACLERGASGIFLATTSWATTQRMTEDDYRLYAREYELKLLNAVHQAEFNVLHICRERNMLQILKDYPAHAFNWDARAKGNLSLSEGRAVVGGKAVIGGLPHQHDLTEASPRELIAEERGMRVAMGKKGWLLGPGCTFTSDAQPANLHAIRQAVETVP
ncbi:MAG: hypothetical protein HYX87_05625 [Chloroflexi bacterium]|nr:hypothetical protein [Chloroflexota bacterium]